MTITFGVLVDCCNKELFPKFMFPIARGALFSHLDCYLIDIPQAVSIGTHNFNNMSSNG